MNPYRNAAKQEDPCEKPKIIKTPPNIIYKTKEQLAIEIFQYAIDVKSNVEYCNFPSIEACKFFSESQELKELKYIPIEQIKLALEDLKNPKKSFYYFVLK